MWGPGRDKQCRDMVEQRWNHGPGRRWSGVAVRPGRVIVFSDTYTPRDHMAEYRRRGLVPPGVVLLTDAEQFEGEDLGEPSRCSPQVLTYCAFNVY